MTITPQAGEPRAQQLRPEFVIGSLQQRVAALTEENIHLVAFVDQMIADVKVMESEMEQLRGGGSDSKESNGARPSTEAHPEGVPRQGEKQDGGGGRGGPSPADLARGKQGKRYS